jgi:hypothetical protein
MTDPHTRARTAAVELNQTVSAIRCKGCPLDDKQSHRRLARAFFGPKVGLGTLNAEQATALAAFLERVSDELMIKAIEVDLTGHPCVPPSDPPAST